MDTTHINRIGHHLSELSMPPCCYPQKAQAAVSFDPNPSRLTYFQLVDQLPCFLSTDCSPLPSRHDCRNVKTNYDCWQASHILTPAQTSAISTFHALYTKLCKDPDSPDITLSDVETFATCFDALLFESGVLHRCSIDFYTDPPITHAGEVQSVHDCSTHHQTHTTRILLTRPPPCSIDSREQRLTDLLGLLLHELCHAYIAIFSSWRHPTAEEALIEQGPMAHGMAWENVMKMACWAAADLLELEIDEDMWLERSADEDEKALQRMITLERWIRAAKPEKEVLERRIEVELGVGREKAEEYHDLWEKGFGRMAVISQLWGWGVWGLWTGEMRGEVEEDGWGSEGWGSEGCP